MRAEEIKGLMEAYSKIHETPEVLNEQTEDLHERVMTAFDAGGGKAKVQQLMRQGVGGVEANRRVSTTGEYLKKQAAKPQPQMKGLSIGQGGFRVNNKPVNPGMSPIFKRPGQETPTPATKPAAPAPKPAATKPAAPAVTKPAAAPAATKPAAPAATKPAAAPAPKPAEAPKKTFNPLMQKTFGYQTGYAPDQVEGNIKKMAQMASLKNISAGVDIFDLVKGHLLDEGYADSEEGAMVIMVNMSEEWKNSILESYGIELDEASYSAKAARAGKDIGKPGKMFGKIAKEAGERYGSEERGKKVAGAILAKLRKEEVDQIDEVQ